MFLYGVHSALNACSERKVKRLEMSNSFGVVVFILRIKKIIKKLKWAESGWTDEQRTSVRGNESVSGELMRREAERSGAERVEWKSEKWGLSCSICVLSSCRLSSLFQGRRATMQVRHTSPRASKPPHSSAQRSFLFFLFHLQNEQN